MKSIALALCALLSAVALDDPIEVDIMTLTKIDWQQGQELPKEIRDLDAKTIVISGYMQAQFRDERKTFLLVSDSCQCSGTPSPHHFIAVTLDEKTEYKPGQLPFMGTLSVGEVVEDGFVKSLYRLEGSFF